MFRNYFRKNEVHDATDEVWWRATLLVLALGSFTALGIAEYVHRTGMYASLGVFLTFTGLAVVSTIIAEAGDAVVNRARLRHNPDSEPLIRATRQTYGE